MLRDTRDNIMNVSDSVVRIEVSIELLRKQIQRKKDLDKLMSNKLFKDIILEGYFKELASNTVMLKASPNHASKDQQEDLDRQLMGIASLNEYFLVLGMKAEIAEKEIAADAITREELLAEDLEE